MESPDTLVSVAREHTKQKRVGNPLRDAAVCVSTFAQEQVRCEDEEEADVGQGEDEAHLEDGEGAGRLRGQNVGKQHRPSVKVV